MAILLLDRYSNASPLGFLPLVGMIGFFAYRSYHARKRSTALVEAVKQHSWEWLGKEVPIDVPMNGLVNPTGNDIYTRNVFGGKHNGRAFIAFDCTISSGRNGHRLNVVTVQAQDNPFRMADSAKITNTEGWFAAAQDGDIDASRTVVLIESSWFQGRRPAAIPAWGEAPRMGAMPTEGRMARSIASLLAVK